MCNNEDKCNFNGSDYTFSTLFFSEVMHHVKFLPKEIITGYALFLEVNILIYHRTGA